ncbi:MAG TPA: ABC transporter permease [Pirellulales bacterium]|nr:ABC transporter permease [Pirellulales bacterium]
MSWVALKMLTGNRGKYIGIILGVAFAALLISQQASIFCGMMLLTTSQIKDIGGADIWVMDPNVRFVDDVKPISENELYRVRGVEGVGWAVRLFKGLTRARMRTGKFQQCILIGLDDASLVGAPQPDKIVMGKIADLRRPDAIFIDEDGYDLLWPGEPLALGRTFEMNDHQATVVGIFRARRTFQTMPVICTRYSQSTLFIPRQRKVMSFILGQPSPGYDSAAVCRRIKSQTGLEAQTRAQFCWTTMLFYLRETGIPANFGITVALGFIIGMAIAGQTFYLFTIENLKQFGTLKAMGASNATLVFMIVLQAVVVASIGYCLGVGAAVGSGHFIDTQSKLAFYMPWQVMAATGVAVMAIALLSSVVSARKVLVLEPAIVFQGS